MRAEDAAKLPYRACVGVLVENRDGLIFAGERIDTPGAWQMPQGGIDAGEAPMAAALRELEEETSIPRAMVSLLAEAPDWIAYDLPLDVIPDRWGGKYRGQTQRWFRFRFEGRDSDIRLETAEPEFARWQWMEAGAMLASIVPFKRETYTEVFRAFGIAA